MGFEFWGIDELLIFHFNFSWIISNSGVFFLFLLLGLYSFYYFLFQIFLF